MGQESILVSIPQSLSLFDASDKLQIIVFLGFWD